MTFNESDWAAAKSVLPCGVLRADDDDDLSALAHKFRDYREECAAELYPIFDILERLLSAGHEIRRHEDGEWAMYSREGEPIATGLTFRELCVNIVLETATNC